MLSLCRVSLVCLRALAYVFTTYEPKPGASCLSDWFSQVWTWNPIGLTLVTGLFLSQSPFPEGSTLTGPGWSTHPLPVPVLEEWHCDWKSHKDHLYWWRSFSKGKEVLLPEGRWEYTLNRYNHSPLQGPSCAEGFTAKLWGRMRQNHPLRGLPGLDSSTIHMGLPPWRCRWHIQGGSPSLHYISPCILPFPFEIMYRHRRMADVWWTANTNEEHDPCRHLSTSKLGTTIHSIKHFKWHNQMRGLWFQKH